MNKCWAHGPEDRATAEEVLAVYVHAGAGLGAALAVVQSGRGECRGPVAAALAVIAVQDTGLSDVDQLPVKSGNSANM